MKPIAIQRPPSLAETVAHAIEELIAHGQFKPGMSLVESRLCEQLEVSRSTLREAFRLLQDRGLIENVPHRGFSVTTLDERKVREIYELRMVLESQAVRWTVERGSFSNEAIELIRAAFRTMCDLTADGTSIDMVEADMNFHRVLCSFCDNTLLLSVLDGLRLHTRRFILFTKLYQSDLATEAETHRPIVEALLAPDQSQLEQVVREHIREAGELLVTRIREMNLMESD